MNPLEGRGQDRLLQGLMVPEWSCRLQGAARRGEPHLEPQLDMVGRDPGAGTLEDLLARLVDEQQPALTAAHGALAKAPEGAGEGAGQPILQGDAPGPWRIGLLGKTGPGHGHAGAEARRLGKGIALHMIDYELEMVELIGAAQVFTGPVAPPVNPSQRRFQVFHRSFNPYFLQVPWLAAPWRFYPVDNLKMA